MKRKYADSPDCSNIIERRINITYVDDSVLSGNFTIFYIDKIGAPLIVEIAGKNICLAENGYIWTQYFPEKFNYALTAIFDMNLNIIELYFDISDGNKTNADGIPYFDDLYLDVVLLSTGEVILLDEDELESALKEKQITKTQYKVAKKEAESLLAYIKENKMFLFDNAKKYLNYMINLDENEKDNSGNWRFLR